MSFDLQSLGPLLAVVAFWCVAPLFLKRDRNRHREAVVVVAVLVGLRYLLWRYFSTLEAPPEEDLSLFATLWPGIVFLFELLAFGEAALFLLVMCKTNTRTAEADRDEKSLKKDFPSVDVFIPTYNEGLDVLEKTIVGAKHIDYPNFKVWVLDDGRREWLRDFCAKKEVGYLTRPDNAHAKAGNINSGLRQTDGELFAIFDADFIPAKNFLRRTVGFFTNNPDIGIVQTPQRFFNRDPIQSNLYLHNIWPDEQRLFFDVMAPARDGWGAAFCCGSCSITRRAAVEKAGGIPTSSITEDILTTLALLRVGYRTVYLNEKLSQGLSAESLEGFFVQRSRWCRGGIQCFFVKEGPLRSEGLSLIQRVLFTPYGWVVQPIARLSLLLIPIIYLWTGAAPLFIKSPGEILSYLVPMLLMFVLAIHWFAPRKYIPIVSTAIGAFSMFRLLPVVISSLVKPFGAPFRVTPKGEASKAGVDWYTLAMACALLAATLAGLIVNLSPETRILTEIQFFPYALFWSTLNIVILSICALLCFDAPRHRKEERFLVFEAAMLDEFPAFTENISLGGCRLRLSEACTGLQPGQVLRLKLTGVSEPLQVEIKLRTHRHLMCQFVAMTDKQRDELILKLFSGRYDNEVMEAAKFRKVLWNLLKRAFGKELE